MKESNISIFLTNLNAYNEGNLIGEWVKIQAVIFREGGK